MDRTRQALQSLTWLLAAPLALVTVAAGVAEPLAVITVEERGLVGVRAWDFHTAGIAVAGLPVAELGVTNMGERVASVVEDLDGDGRFNGADQIIFFGQRRRDEGIYRYRYADHNAYLLERWPEGAAPAPPRERPWWLGPVRAMDAEVPLSFQRLHHFEEDRFWSDLFSHPGSSPTDFAFYTELSFLGQPERVVRFDVPEVDVHASAPFTLTLLLYGRSDASRVLGVPDHSIDVEINGQRVGRVEFDRAVEHRAVFEGLDPSMLRPHGNELRLALVERGVPIDVVYLDWFEVQCPSLPVLTDDRGEFALPGPSAGRTVALKGLSTAQAHLFCLTTETVVPLEATPESALTRTVRFTAPCDDGLYALATSHRLLRPASLRPYAPEVPLDSERGVDWVVITHPDFREAAERLAEHRRVHDGFSTLVIDLFDLYDRFGHGLPNPEAIKTALTHIYSQWPEPKLRHVVLMGDASWDHHQVAHSNPTFVPTHYYQSAELDYSSDAHFAMVDSQEVPRYAVGRLPVSTPRQALAVVDKLIAYDEALSAGGNPGPEWRQRLIIAASDNQLYRNLLNQVADDFVGDRFEVIRAFATNESPLDCTQLLIDTINEGVALVSYVGHGARYIWQTGTTLARRATDYDANFNPERVDDLFNGTRLPLVFGITCFTNNFDNPNPRNCIGEKMILRPEGGAIASIATSSYSYVHSDMVFCQALFETLFEERPERVGDLYLASLAKSSISRDVRRMFIILGDPASRLPLSPREVSPETQAAQASADPPIGEAVAEGASRELGSELPSPD